MTLDAWLAFALPALLFGVLAGVSMEECDPSTIASLLRNGGRVLFEGRKR